MHIIIGQGAAGWSAARTLRRLKPKLAITMISEEKDFFYSRIDLPDIIKGVISPDRAILAPPERFAALGIDCRMGERVERLVPGEKTVVLATGERLAYDKLLLATGSQPFVPPVPGMDAHGVFTLWTLEDARRIIAATGTAKRAVVAGAGLIGLKAALALRALGLEVTVVEKMPTVMPRQLDALAAGLLEARLRAQGITILTGTSVDAVLTGDGVVTGVRAGMDLPCELVICAVGVRPNIALAREAGLTTGLGIAVDARQRTSDPAVFAAGDVAESIDCLSGDPVVPAIWPVAVEQGRVAAYGMVGQAMENEPSLAMNSVDIAGLPLVSFGDVIGGPEDEIRTRHQGEHYRKVVLRDGVVRGALCLGDISRAGVLGNLVRRGTRVDGPDLLSPRFNVLDLQPETGWIA